MNLRFQGAASDGKTTTEASRLPFRCIMLWASGSTVIRSRKERRKRHEQYFLHYWCCGGSALHCRLFWTAIRLTADTSRELSSRTQPRLGMVVRNRFKSEIASIKGAALGCDKRSVGDGQTGSAATRPTNRGRYHEAGYSTKSTAHKLRTKFSLQN